MLDDSLSVQIDPFDFCQGNLGQQCNVSQTLEPLLLNRVLSLFLIWVSVTAVAYGMIFGHKQIKQEVDSPANKNDKFAHAMIHL